MKKKKKEIKSLRDNLQADYERDFFFLRVIISSAELLSIHLYYLSRVRFFFLK